MMAVTGKLKPMPGKVFVEQLENGQRVSMGGILIPDDNMKNQGIRPRWGKVWAVGEGVEGIAVGEWILIEHGRWSFGIDIQPEDGEAYKVWMVEYPKSVLLASDVFPSELKPTGK